MGALLNMSNGSQPGQWADIKQSAQAFDMQAQLFDVRKTADLPAAFDVADQQHMGAFIIALRRQTKISLPNLLKSIGCRQFIRPENSSMPVG